MKIASLIWLTQFVEKIERKHGVSIDEVNEVFTHKPQIRLIERGRVGGENLYRAIGQTDDGRYLAAFLIYKGEERVLVISARDAGSGERKIYGRHKK